MLSVKPGDVGDVALCELICYELSDAPEGQILEPHVAIVQGMKLLNIRHLSICMAKLVFPGSGSRTRASPSGQLTLTVLFGID
ncbi:hypothetical protein E4U39_004376 [Claviceps sp. Clav50 group G5]|nr:hypothetical protein E4U39_004376 [Claviceps sp. Clav50 group G5]